MPTMPVALAERAERIFGHPAEVSAVDVLSAGLLRVTFAGPGLVGRRYEPGKEIEFRIGGGYFRHYTPTSFDAVGGACSVVFALAANGPGTVWVRGLRPRDPVLVLGPGGGVRWRAELRPVLLGDATAIGLFQALAAAADVPPVGAVEVPAADAEAVRGLLPELDVLTLGDRRGDALDDWLEEHLPALDDSSERAYLAGHVGTGQRLRRRLREAGWGRGDAVVKAHWTEQKAGL